MAEPGRPEHAERQPAARAILHIPTEIPEYKAPFKNFLQKPGGKGRFSGVTRRIFGKHALPEPAWQGRDRVFVPEGAVPCTRGAQGSGRRGGFLLYPLPRAADPRLWRLAQALRTDFPDFRHEKAPGGAFRGRLVAFGRPQEVPLPVRGSGTVRQCIMEGSHRLSCGKATMSPTHTNRPTT